MNELYRYKADVIRVIDGDTIEVDIDLGFNMSASDIHLRFDGVNAPETRTKDQAEKTAGLEVKEKLQSLIHKNNNTVYCHVVKKGKYGRWITKVYLDKGFKRSINKRVKQWTRKVQKELSAIISQS